MALDIKRISFEDYELKSCRVINNLEISSLLGETLKKHNLTFQTAKFCFVGIDEKHVLWCKHNGFTNDLFKTIILAWVIDLDFKEDGSCAVYEMFSKVLYVLPKQAIVRKECVWSWWDIIRGRDKIRTQIYKNAYKTIVCFTNVEVSIYLYRDFKICNNVLTATKDIAHENTYDSDGQYSRIFTNYPAMYFLRNTHDSIDCGEVGL